MTRIFLPRTPPAALISSTAISIPFLVEMPNVACRSGQRSVLADDDLIGGGPTSSIAGSQYEDATQEQNQSECVFHERNSNSETLSVQAGNSMTDAPFGTPRITVPAGRVNGLRNRKACLCTALYS